MFSGVMANVEPKGACYAEWMRWVERQWRSIIGCLSTTVFLLFFNIIAANWRIHLICTKDNKDTNE
jgi:hypothetical protein